MAGFSIAFRAGVVLLTVATIATIVGCTATPSAAPTTTPTKTAAPHSSPTPKPSPTPTFAALKYTCDSILPPATLAVFKSKQSAGFTLQNDYLQRMQNIGSQLVAFNTYGGILCQWAYPDSSNNVAYAFSPITNAEADTQEQALEANGYVGTSKDHGTLYANTDSTDFPDEYLFINGYWMQGSTDNVMQLLVDNVFVTSN
jgi:hypothetical protein